MISHPEAPADFVAGPTDYLGSYISGYLRCLVRIFGDEQRAR